MFLFVHDFEEFLVGFGALHALEQELHAFGDTHLVEDAPQDPGSVVVIIAGTFWFVERVFFSGGMA